MAAPLAGVVAEVIHGDALTGGGGSWGQVGVETPDLDLVSSR
jgi:hypothetical protein